MSQTVRPTPRHRGLHAAALALTLTAALAFVAAPAAIAKPSKPAKEEIEKTLATLERATKSADFATRAMAVEALGYGPKKRVLPAIKDALSDPQWNVRSGAIRALLALKDKRGWEKAVRDAMVDPKVDADFGVMPLIDHLGPKKGVKFLTKSLKSSKFPRPERFVTALVRKGGAWATQGFAAGLKLKKGPARDAFEAQLAKLPLAEAAPVFAKHLKKSSTETQKKVLARVEAAPELKKANFLAPLVKSKDADLAFGAAVELAKRSNAAGKKILTDAVAGEDAIKKGRALGALSGIATKDMFDVARPILKDRASDLESLLSAYAIFVKVGSKKLQTHLEGKLTSTDVQHRAAAIHYIGDVKGRAALDDLYAPMVSGPTLIRATAARSVGRLAQRGSITKIQDALGNEREKEVKLALIEALGMIKDADIIPVVRFYVTDRDADIRAASVKTLVSVAHERAVKDLELVMRDRDRELRRMALQALMDLDSDKHLVAFDKALGWAPADFVLDLAEEKKERVLKHVEAAIASSREEMRSAGFAALSSMGKSTRAEQYTMLAKTSRHQALRLAAMKELVDLQGKRATDVLKELAEDKDLRIKISAIEALGKLGDASARTFLLGMTDDPNESLRVASAAALMRL